MVASRFRPAARSLSYQDRYTRGQQAGTGRATAPPVLTPPIITAPGYPVDPVTGLPIPPPVAPVTQPGTQFTAEASMPTTFSASASMPTTFMAAAPPMKETGGDTGGSPAFIGGKGQNYSNENERAAILRSLINGRIDPALNVPPPVGGSPATGGGGSGSSGGGGGWSSGGSGGGGGSRGGGGGGRSAAPAAPAAPPSRVQVGTGTSGYGGPRLKSQNNWSYNPNTKQWMLNGVVVPTPVTVGPGITPPPVVTPPVIDPGTGQPVVPPPPVPGQIVAPGYQIPPSNEFAATALSVPDPAFQQYLASQGALGAASISTPYIPTVNAPIAAASTPLSAAAVPPSPTYAGPLPPALNSGNLAGNYSEVGSDMFAEQPELLLRDMLNQQYGQGNAGGLYTMLEPYADNLNALYLGQAGQNATAGNKADFTNWLSSQWGNMQRPGTYTNTDLAIRNILNPSPSSPLAAYVTEGDPQEQYRNTANLLGSAISMGYHPLFASAMMNRLKQAGLDYQGQAARGGVAMDPFYKYLQTSAGIPSLSQLVGA